MALIGIIRAWEWKQELLNPAWVKERVPDAAIGGKAPDGVLVLSQRSIPVSGPFTQHVNDPGLPRDPLLFIGSGSGGFYLFMQPIQVQIAPRRAVATPTNRDTFRDELTATSFTCAARVAAFLINFFIVAFSGKEDCQHDSAGDYGFC